MNPLKVTLRLTGVYEVDPSQYKEADYCLLPYSFGADELEPMTNRATGHGYELSITVEPEPDEASATPQFKKIGG